jgi:hypothetical protein
VVIQIMLILGIYQPGLVLLTHNFPPVITGDIGCSDYALSGHLLCAL